MRSRSNTEMKTVRVKYTPVRAQEAPYLSDPPSALVKPRNLNTLISGVFHNRSSHYESQSNLSQINERDKGKVG